MADIDCVLHDVANEVDKAIDKFPKWPIDPLHAAAIVGEESGELTKAVLQSVYEPQKSTLADARQEAIQTAAMCVRFILMLDSDDYVTRKSDQKFQEA